MRMAKPKTVKQGRPKAPQKMPVSQELAVREVEVRQTWATAAVRLATGIAVAVVVLAAWPVASVVAGESTVISVNLALSFTIAVSIAGVGVALWGWKQKRRADQAEKRGRELARDVKELQQRLRDAGLSDEVSRV